MDGVPDMIYKCPVCDKTPLESCKNICGHYICKHCEEPANEMYRVTCTLCDQEYEEELKPRIDSRLQVKLKENSKLAFLNK